MSAKGVAVFILGCLWRNGSYWDCLVIVLQFKIWVNGISNPLSLAKSSSRTKNAGSRWSLRQLAGGRNWRKNNSSFRKSKGRIVNRLSQSTNSRRRMLTLNTLGAICTISTSRSRENKNKISKSTLTQSGRRKALQKPSLNSLKHLTLMCSSSPSYLSRRRWRWRNSSRKTG